MSRAIGESFDFYVRHYSDMEVLESIRGFPEGVAIAHWQKIRAVINAASWQARMVLTEASKALIASLGDPRVVKYNQTTTLNEQWSMRVGLRRPNTSSELMIAGFDIQVAASADARLVFWLRTTYKPKTNQKRLIEALKDFGAKPRAETVQLDELPLKDGVSVDTCARWATERSRDIIGVHWEQLVAIAD